MQRVNSEPGIGEGSTTSAVRDALDAAPDDLKSDVAAAAVLAAPAILDVMGATIAVPTLLWVIAVILVIAGFVSIVRGVLEGDEPLSTEVDDPNEVDLSDERLFAAFSSTRLGGSSALLALSGARRDGRPVHLRNPAALGLKRVAHDGNGLVAHSQAGSVCYKAVGLYGGDEGISEHCPRDRRLDTRSGPIFKEDHAGPLHMQQPVQVWRC